MKLKNSDIVRIFQGMPGIRKKRLPIKIGFAVNKNMNVMRSIAESYDTERAKILDKYGEKDESGKIKTDGDEYILADKKSYTEEMKELLSIESKIEIHMVTLDEIEKCDSEKFDALTPDELELLEFMIEA